MTVGIPQSGAMDAEAHNSANDEATANFTSIQENIRENNKITTTQGGLTDILVNAHSQFLNGIETTTGAQSGVASGQSQKITRLF